MCWILEKLKSCHSSGFEVIQPQNRTVNPDGSVTISCEHTENVSSVEDVRLNVMSPYVSWCNWISGIFVMVGRWVVKYTNEGGWCFSTLKCTLPLVVFISNLNFFVCLLSVISVSVILISLYFLSLCKHITEIVTFNVLSVNALTALIRGQVDRCLCRSLWNYLTSWKLNFIPRRILKLHPAACINTEMKPVSKLVNQTGARTLYCW